MNFVKIPFSWPFKMVPVSSAPGIHFDDSWDHEQMKSWEYNRNYLRYKQKWVRTDTTPLQLESTIFPNDMIIYDVNRTPVKTIEWTLVHSDVSFGVYQLTFDISDLPPGVYFNYQMITGGAIEWPFISEPIHSADSWPNTLLYRYKNSYNDNDVMWKTGVEFKFRVESAIMEFAPDRERTDYVNQTRDVKTLRGVPYRKFKLLVAPAPGVPPYMVDVLNRIFCCDFVAISYDGTNELQYETDSGAKWEIQRARGYHFIGAAIDVVPAQNVQSLQKSVNAPLAPGIVIAYNIETSFFGNGPVVPVTEVLTNE